MEKGRPYGLILPKAGQWDGGVKAHNATIATTSLHPLLQDPHARLHVNTEDKTVTAHLTSGKKTIIYENGMFKYQGRLDCLKVANEDLADVQLINYYDFPV